MGLQIKIEGGRYRPVVACDHCGEEIDDARQGNYQWRVEENGNPADGGLIFFTHKRCCRPFEESNGGRVGWCWTPLSCLPVFLVNNLSLDWEKAKETAQLMASL
jgi:hypothetical protein